MIVMGSDRDLKPGDRVVISGDALAQPIEQPAIVIRKATRDEWAKCVEEYGGKPEPWHQRANYYLVSTD